MDNEEKIVEEVKEQVTKTEDNKKTFERPRRPKKPFRKDKKESPYKQTIISINRVTKVTKGGRILRFGVTVVIGDEKGKVGMGTGKAAEIPDATAKAVKMAEKNLINVPIVDGRTLPHDIIGKHGAASVMLKPASAGTGVIAGGAARAVLEFAGVKDVLTKNLGSNTKINVARATLDGLKKLKTIESVAALRGKTKEEILG